LKILFDANVPKGLRHFLKHHDVRTAKEQGWDAVEMVNKSTEFSFQTIDLSALGPPRVRKSDPES